MRDGCRLSVVFLPPSLTILACRFFRLPAHPQKDAQFSLPGLELVGRTLDYWNGSISQRPGVNFHTHLRNSLQTPLNNQVWNAPDEIIGAASFRVESSPAVSVETSLAEFARYEQIRHGVGTGFQAALGLGGSPVVAAAAKTLFYDPKLVSLHSDLFVSSYVLRLLPPQFVSLRDEISNLFSSLPRFDNSSRDLWLSIIGSVGTHIITSATMGGNSQLSITVNSSIIDLPSSSLREQAALLSTATFDPDPARRSDAASKIDPAFRSASTITIRRLGGDSRTELSQADWIASLGTSPAWLRLESRPLSDYFPSGSQLRQDLVHAIDHYMFSKLDPPLLPLFLGPEFDAATVVRGASVNVSSIRTECSGRCWADSFTHAQCVDSNCDHPCCDPTKPVRTPVLPRFVWLSLLSSVWTHRSGSAFVKSTHFAAKIGTTTATDASSPLGVSTVIAFDGDGTLLLAIVRAVVPFVQYTVTETSQTRAAAKSSFPPKSFARIRFVAKLGGK